MERRRKELALIHVAKRDLVKSGGLTEDGYRTIVAGVLMDRGLAHDPDTPSAADLDAGGRSAVVAVFRDELGWNDPARRAPRKPKGRYVGRGKVGDGHHLTQEQASEISRLEDLLDWKSRERLKGFIFRVTGKTKSVEMLGGREASNVITALRRMTQSRT